MKTAIQELIEEIQYWKEKAPLGSAFRDCLIVLEGSATNKLEKEKNRMKEVKETKLVDKKSNQPNDIGGGFQNSGVWQTDGLSGFRG